MADSRPERPEVITLSIPSRLELLNLVDQVASVLSAHLRFGEEERAAISLAVVEAGTNAIQHGHKHDGVTPVDLRFELLPDRLRVTVHDRGPGFAPPAETPDMTSPEHLLDQRGRGIFIMRACMDRVAFDFSAGGTTVRLEKFAPPAPNGSDPPGS
jgi:serine/threonine-protein kinase RsbW